MVKLCAYQYPKKNEALYEEYYRPYSYELHDFQKWCVEGVVTGNHVLICCPTGSGKTFGGEFALHFFHTRGKKTIYTSPIKALSNEKFHQFTQKYPHISFGLITGDIKTNPDADVLIMTTEILMNKLYQIRSTHYALSTASPVSFDMDIEHELGCVVFDEIHMINDESRGHVWEQCIMLLPAQVQMVGLSATLDDPERFAYWLETRGKHSPSPPVKEVYLTRKQVRAVPLLHYGFLAVPNGIFKAVRDKSLQEEIKQLVHRPLLIQDARGQFQDAPFQQIQRMLQLFGKHNIQVKRPFVLNRLAEHLVQNEMLPALCYVFSRKALEKCADELTTNLLEFDSKIPYTVDYECEQIIRKLPNYEEYLHLPEYVQIVKWLRKGIGVHHAGLMPVLREMVELMFAKGCVKWLFCTETMSVGINLPVKTTIFTDLYKYNGERIRLLYSHEYTQSAGRAGRLGLDTVGHVIHLNNLIRRTDSVNYKQMMNGKPQSLISKFKISYNLLLNLIDTGEQTLTPFVSQSLFTGELDSQMGQVKTQLDRVEKELDDLNACLDGRTPVDVLKQFAECARHFSQSVNKKKREWERRMNDLRECYKWVDTDMEVFTRLEQKQREWEDLDGQRERLTVYFDQGVETVMRFLREGGFVESIADANSDIIDIGHPDAMAPCRWGLTAKGQVACQLKEVHCLVFSELYMDNLLQSCNSTELAMLFSCFTSVRVDETRTDHCPKTDNDLLRTLLRTIWERYDWYQKRELERSIHTGTDYGFHYDLLPYVEKWCACESADACKQTLQDIAREKGVFLGEFVKALLKINNIASEFQKIAEMRGDVQFLSRLNELPSLTLKFVVTNQSLYV